MTTMFREEILGIIIMPLGAQASPEGLESSHSHKERRGTRQYQNMRPCPCLPQGNVQRRWWCGGGGRQACVWAVGVAGVCATPLAALKRRGAQRRGEKPSRRGAQHAEPCWQENARGQRQ